MRDLKIAFKLLRPTLSAVLSMGYAGDVAERLAKEFTRKQGTTLLWFHAEGTESVSEREQRMLRKCPEFL